MQTVNAGSTSESPSLWQRLKNRELSCEEALKQLVDPQGVVNLELLDRTITDRFLELFPKGSAPHVIPLLLWQAVYYLGTPKDLTPEERKAISDRTQQIKLDIRPIAVDSYRQWYKRQNLPDPRSIDAKPMVNPFTGQPEAHDIREIAEMSLAQADSQRERINSLISNALRNRASDIHLEPTLQGLRVRYRIDGILHDITTLSQDVSRPVVVALKVMSSIDIGESRRPQDGRIGQNYSDAQASQNELDMRVSTLPCVGGEKVVIRLLQRSDNQFSDLGTLGFSEETLTIYKNWLQQPQGLIIFTGPTGSGKTSTLYTSLQTIAHEHVNVTTVEDPVEYVLPRITQTQVNEKAGMTFSSGLRAILRQDPDIIMVGEVRDRETADTVVRAALTGHLVLTTMHTNDAPTAIPRLKDIGPDPGLISDALLGVVGQRLVRKVCPHCAEPHTPSEADLTWLGLEPTSANLKGWKKGRGCSKCFNSGFLGREAVVELLDMDEMVRQLVYEGTMTQLHRYLMSRCYYPFRLGAVEKVLRGVTTLAEVRRVLPQSALQLSSVSRDPDATSGLSRQERILPGKN